eukprot:173538_1
MPPRHPKFRIEVNVYDLGSMNGYLNPVGLGAYHTGVVISGAEYFFGGGTSDGTGVSVSDPGYAPGAAFRESIFMGEIQISRVELDRAIDRLRYDFKAADYHVIHLNCNHFSDALCMELLQKPIPGWINRMAWWGRACSCLWPDDKSAETDRLASERKSNFRAFEGTGYQLSSTPGTTQPSSPDERRRLMAEAASRRLLDSGQ